MRDIGVERKINVIVNIRMIFESYYAEMILMGEEQQITGEVLFT